MGVFKFNYPSSSAGASCNQLLPIAAVMDKISPNVERREETDRYKNEIKRGSHVLYKNCNDAFNSFLPTRL
jgi:hypothetical protein